MAGNTYCVTLAQSTSDSVAVGNSTSEAIAIPDLTLAANYFSQGKRLRLTAWGAVSNVVTAVPTITFRVRIGSATLSATYATASGALAFTATALTSGTWRAEVDIVCRTTGTAGTGLALGQVFIPNLTAATTVGGEGYSNFLPVTTPTAGTINTTIANLISFSAQWSAANAANTITTMFYTWEELN